MGSFSVWHWLIVLLIVVPRLRHQKLKNIGSDLGGAVKGFKDGMRDGSARRTRRPHHRRRWRRRQQTRPTPSTCRPRRALTRRGSTGA